MGTLHGKGSVLYMSGASGEAAVKIAEAVEWSIDLDHDEDPDPALGDEWETRLKGHKRFSGAFSGNFDDAQDTLWDAFNSAASSKFYLYPEAAAPTRYYYGNIWPKPSMAGSQTSKETFSATFSGDGQLAKNPA